LLLKTITKKSSFLRGILEESKILFMYRYISLFVTSAFYFFGEIDHLLGKKVFIITCLTISAVILSYLYLIYEDSNKNILLLIFIETIGNSILLIPSGGINSPFIWYTLNTILISTVFLKKKYCWINIFVYILFSSIIIYFGTDNNLNILQFLKEESNLILSLIMIMAAVQVWSIYIRKTKEKSERLEEVNIELELANKMIIESMDHIKSLYQSVNIISNQGNKEGLIKLSFENIKKVTKTKLVFYYDISDMDNKMIFDGNQEFIKQLEDKIRENLSIILDYKVPMEIYISNTRFIILTVKSTFGDYGVFGLETIENKESILYKNNINQLQFLSELVSIAFERFNLEEINERLLITEEQNRIANDIHDSVLQRLFSMSCGTFALIKKLDRYSKENIEEELNLIRKTTDIVMKELRDKIYGLSWKKSGNNSFIIDIKKYIEDIRKFNNINIPFTIIGSDELLSSIQKKALYRMICEGIGNAVRHGKAKNIIVSLNINSSMSILMIEDDGVGFDMAKVMANRTNGIGIQNLYQLTESLHGDIQIHSKKQGNTTIEIRLPNNIVLMKREEMIV